MSTSPPLPTPLTVSAGHDSWTLRPGDVFTVGRSRECSLALDDARVSRKHAWIQLEGTTWVLHSQGGNGTFADGRRVDTLPLTGPVTVNLGDAEGPELRACPAAPPATATPRPFSDVPISTRGDQGPESMSIRIGGAMVAPPREGIAQTAAHVPPPSQQRGTGAPGQGGVAVPHGAQAVITIGRGRDNVIVVDDLLVSRHHTRLVPDGRGGYQVEDLGSRNGTYVDGARVERAALGPGSLLSVGHSQFRVEDGRLVATVDQGNVPFVAAGISFVLPGGKKLLDDVSFSADGATLTAVIGPSGAGKSTILNALTGNRPATSGRVFYDNRDLYENYDDLRHRIGLVPQDDVVHRQLNVRQALSYAAELRFPDDLDKSLREQRVDEVIAELELTKHVDTRIDKLSGGQRKRVSVALELLTRPSLLFLDEPTSGLDPGLDKQVMNLLRNLADGGRTVFVVTHSVANLDVCDRVLLLAPGGKVAYYGPPQEMLAYFGASDHADVFTMATDDPDGVKNRFLASPLYERYIAAAMNRSLPQPGVPAPPLEPSRQQSIPRQLSTLIRRHLKVIFADRSYAAFMGLMPLGLALLAVIMPGTIGFAIPPLDVLRSTRFDPPAPQQVSQLLLVLIIGAAFMGAAASSRELVGERAIWLRERSVGLSPFAYLMGKIIVFLLLSVVQSAILVGVVLLFKKHPDRSALLGNGMLEIYLACLVTAFVCAIVGLLLSSFVSTSEQVMPLLVLFVMAQLVLAGALFSLAKNPVLNVVSWAAPGRWGFAGTAASVELNRIAPKDALWKPPMYLLDLVILLGIGAVLALVTLARLKRKATR